MLVSLNREFLQHVTTFFQILLTKKAMMRKTKRRRKRTKRCLDSLVRCENTRDMNGRNFCIECTIVLVSDTIDFKIYPISNLKLVLI